MAAEARDHLGRLPTELFCLVVEDHGLSTRDLAALAATCRKCYIITNPILYQKHIKEEGSQACKRYHVHMLLQNQPTIADFNHLSNVGS